MADQDKGSWAIVAALFTTLFFIWGSVNASSVFFLPVVKHFGWSRALFSGLVSAAPLAAGITSPLIGSLLDRVGTRRVMVTGVAMVAAAYIALSRANSALAFLLIFVVLGVGITASTIIPTALVITRRFRERRGTALGIAFAGIPLGGTVISVWANYIVRRFGFRIGYFVMAVPMLVLVIPALLIFLRVHRGQEGVREQTSQSAQPGLEVREALKTRSFWMIAIAEVLFATAGVGIRVHLVPFLTGAGYSPTVAAEMFGAMFIFSAIGSFIIGPSADSLGGRKMLSLVFAAASIGIAALLGAQHVVAVVAFLLIFGLVRETPALLLPIAVGESLGTRRLGALLGIQAFFTTLGFAAGPLIAGRIFDVSGSYAAALVLFAAMTVVSAIAIRATLPFSKEQERFVIGETAAA